MQRSLIFLLSQHTPPLQSSRADIVYSFLLEKFSLFTKLRWFTTSNWNLFSKKPTNIYFQVTNPTNPKLPNIGLKLAGGGGAVRGREWCRVSRLRTLPLAAPVVLPRLLAHPVSHYAETGQPPAALGLSPTPTGPSSSRQPLSPPAPALPRSP